MNYRYGYLADGISPEILNNIKMKKSIFSLLFFFSMVVAHAQQQDYKVLLDTFYHHSENSFKDIIGEQSDTLSSFYPSKLMADVGEVKIGKYPYAVTLNWTIPLAQSSKVQIDVKDFMRVTYADSKLYKIASDGTEEEGYITTNIYALGAAKPLLVFQTVYYKNSEALDKSQFVITMYGK